MPAILTSSLMNSNRTIRSKSRSAHSKRNRRSSSSLHSHESRASSLDGSDTTLTSIYSTHSNSSLSTSFSLSQLSNSTVDLVEENNETNWGYYVDITAKDEELEQYSCVLQLRNKSRMALVRQARNI